MITADVLSLIKTEKITLSDLDKQFDWVFSYILKSSIWIHTLITVDCGLLKQHNYHINTNFT